MFEAKLLPWSFSGEMAAEKYMVHKWRYSHSEGERERLESAPGEKGTQASASA